MTVTPLIDAKIAQITDAIAKERAEFVSAVSAAIAPLTTEIAVLQSAIADLKTQVEAGSAAQSTLAALESSVVAKLQQVATDIDAIVTTESTPVPVADIVSDLSVEPVADSETPA